MPDESPRPRYRRQRRETPEERAAKMQSYRLLAQMIQSGQLPPLDYAGMLTAAWRQRQADVAENVPVLVEEDDENLVVEVGGRAAGWRSATEYVCCLSRFRWGRRPVRLDTCPLCEAPVPEPVPPEVVERLALETRVRETPEDARPVNAPSRHAWSSAPDDGGGLPGSTMPGTPAEPAPDVCDECHGRPGGCFRCDGASARRPWWSRWS
jgi:hypothetical protein